jgi:formate/nitrite transporter FocA (FNT family)
MMLKASNAALPAAYDAITIAGMMRNLVPVIAGNIIGGSVLVALVYHFIYRRPAVKA